MVISGDVQLRRADPSDAEAIAMAYVEHVSAALAHFTKVARAVAGRDVAHVLLHTQTHSRRITLDGF